ncbi:SPOR domain-containing protein [uncultured Novosphingobium sp.]|uniref:SPOR domain-containing protein n=1 Tax=uncultured Novosphingobium sp. TaxID=292277 RepID=UPI00338E7E9F
MMAVRWGNAATLATMIVLCGLAVPALADVKAGVDAWGNGDFPAAVREWQAAADAGDPDAQFNLAQAYRLGRGVPRDPARAEALFGQAAAQGHVQAADNYGLLLFQRGERQKAMPYIRSAAARGDARAQYIQGLALFNGDGAPKDWVRAYAYLTLAQQAGLPQATSALRQMDQHVPMADRQKSVTVAAQIAQEAEATRARQLAALDLSGPSGNTIGNDGTAPVGKTSRGAALATVERAVSDAERAAATPSRRSAGADFTNTTTSPAKPKPVQSVRPAVSTVQPPSKPAPVPTASGGWRLQLGAFGVAGNADALWSRVKGRPELAGHAKILASAGKLTKLQAGGFASQADATAACARLRTAGFTCLATRD